jgi:hypothetical protein
LLVCWLLGEIAPPPQPHVEAPFIYNKNGVNIW